MSLTVSFPISAILVGLALRCRCSSCTWMSISAIVSPTHGLRRDRASASGIFLPGTYVISTSYFWMRSSILAMRGGALDKGFLKVASNGLWSDSTTT